MSTNAFLALLLLAAALLQGQERTRTLRGTLVYSQKMALPRDAGIIVELADLTDDGAIVARTRWQNPSRQVPIPFALAVPVRSILEEHRYELRAEILIQRKRWFFGVRSIVGAELRRPGKPLVVSLDRSP